MDSVHAMAKVTKIVRTEPLQEVGLLKKADGSMCTSAKDTIDVLLNEHFPNCDLGKEDDGAPTNRKIWVQELPWINMERISQAIYEFSPLKACGQDGIKPIVLQNLPKRVLECLVKVLTACVTLAYTPKTWRTSIVQFIPKPGKPDKTDPRAYRPISLMSYLLKTLERLVLYHLDETAFENNPMHEKQFAFRKDIGTDNALSNTVNEIEKGIANQEYVMVVFLDIKGAFDNVTTSAIMKSMINHGVPIMIQKWYKNYLDNRFSESAIGLERGRCKNSPYGSPNSI